MKERITNGMLIALIINMIYPKSIGVSQGVMAREIGSDIWLSTLFSCVQALIIMIIVVSIVKNLPKEPVFSGKAKLFVNGLKRLIYILLFIFFIGAFGDIMLIFVYHLRDYFLPEAQTWIFVLLGTLIGIYAIFHGIEVSGRLALLGVIFVVLFNILLLLGSLKQFDIRELQPVFNSGVGNTYWASRHMLTDWASAIMVAIILVPTVNKIESVRKSSIIGVLFATGIMIIWPILEVGVLSSEITAQYIVSCMQMARSAEIGLFIHRYEMIMVAFFAFSIFTQIITTLYCASYSAKQIFNLQDYRKMIIPSAIILSGYSLWLLQDHHHAMHITENQRVTIGLWLLVIIPILIFILGFIYKKKNKNGATSN
ncbi:MAG: spore gernimation protein [Bacillales bacterium]|nr:spore gernimation protein [Bacillales bacterium]